MLEDYINQLVIDLEIEEDVTTDTKDSYQIPIDENINVNITELQPGVAFKSIIAEIPDQSCEELLADVMDSNLFNIGRNEAVLGMDKEGKNLILSQSITYEIDYQELKNQLEDFANTIDFWQSEIHNQLEQL